MSQSMNLCLATLQYFLLVWPCLTVFYGGFHAFLGYIGVFILQASAEDLMMLKR